ncbi:MAG: GNAT family N-acetyltransferase [Anaerolineales bacterium]
MPELITERLSIRPFQADDFPMIHQILDQELAEASIGADSADSQARREWLTWSIMNYEQLRRLRQPPYGDRAIQLLSTGQVIGACGWVPCLGEFSQIPGLAPASETDLPGFNTTEMGIFYAISTRYQRQGYASEAAAALVAYSFGTLRVRRVIATTDYDNAGSMGVMRRIGMTLGSNPTPTPPWLQVVGHVEHPESRADRAHDL